MKSDKTNLLAGELLEDHAEMSLEQLCLTYKLSREEVVNMVDEGIIDPLGNKPAVWRFQAISLRRVRITLTFSKTLGSTCKARR